MLTRVTNQMTALQSQQHLQASAARLSHQQDRASSLKAIGVPSDDPAGAAEALRVKGLQSAAAQHGRNVDDGAGWLTTADGALRSADAVLAKLDDDAVKNDLRARTDEAIALGVFGAPTFIVNGKDLYWGQDRIHFVERALTA